MNLFYTIKKVLNRMRCKTLNYIFIKGALRNNICCFYFKLIFFILFSNYNKYEWIVNENDSDADKVNRAFRMS